MRHIGCIFIALLICATSFSQRRVETMDENRWHWKECSDKYQSVSFEDGYLAVTALKKNKKYTDYQNNAKTFARLPIRPNDDYKLTIKYIVQNYYNSWYTICFNTSKQCLDDDDESGDFSTYYLQMFGPYWVLNVGDGQKHTEKLQGKVKSKEAKDYPMELFINKKHNKVEIELNGIQIFKGDCTMNEPCIGFMVPALPGILKLYKFGSTLKIDEIIIEQAEGQDD